MNSSKDPIINDDEPFDGWQRFEIPGGKCWFKTPPPRIVIRDFSKLEDFLEKEHSNGRMLEINRTHFSFKRRYGLKKITKKSNDVPQNTVKNSGPAEATSIIERLTRNGLQLDHKRTIFESTKSLDSFRLQEDKYSEQDIENLKSLVATSSDMREMVNALCSNDGVMSAITQMTLDIFLSEICMKLRHLNPDISLNLKNRWQKKM